MPSAATGAWPSAQPVAFTTFTTGISEPSGRGSAGLGPTPAETGARLVPPHPAAKLTARQQDKGTNDMQFLARSMGTSMGELAR